MLPRAHGPAATAPKPRWARPGRRAPHRRRSAPRAWHPAGFWETVPALQPLTQQHEWAPREAGVLQVQDHQAAADAQGACHEGGRVVQQRRVSGVQVLQAVRLGGRHKRDQCSAPHSLGHQVFFGRFSRLGLRPSYFTGQIPSPPQMLPPHCPDKSPCDDLRPSETSFWSPHLLQIRGKEPEGTAEITPCARTARAKLQA